MILSVINLWRILRARGGSSTMLKAVQAGVWYSPRTRR